MLSVTLANQRTNDCQENDGRGGGIRTHGLCTPSAARYQAAPRPDDVSTLLRNRFFGKFLLNESQAEITKGSGVISHKHHLYLRMLKFRGILALLFVWGCLLASASAFRTVVIDAGHGGKDDGAKRYGVKEKDLNLDTAKRLEKILKRRGFHVVMTRRTDRFLHLQERAKIANRYQDAVFISIHYNAHPDTSVKGIETFYATLEGRKLASGIQNHLTKRIRQTRDRGIKSGKQYAVLNKTRMVSVLVEGGFISNSWERSRLNGAWYRQIVAEQIARGIVIHK
jgi:N-acetylmuramoyl-L-alanine amidase